MNPILWFVSIGILLIIMTMITASLKRWSITAAIPYLCFGYVLGPSVVGLIQIDPLSQGKLLEHLTEVAILIALVGLFLLAVPLGGAVLLGAMLAPTDPVLAASVQVLGPEDRDKLRFSLTGEAGMNDGTAFPLVMLGLGLLELREMGHWGWRWFLLDVVWGIAGG